ncbi:MAG: PH domain-containing protein [Candidatus Pacebacteria bacterium]|nr:PH domain-containing protein [Candidatus Paceibacterota bacterium]
MIKKSINLHKIDKYTFPGQHDNEKVVLILRKHPISLFVYAIQLLFFSLLPILVYIFLIPIVFPAFLEYPYQNVYILLSTIFYGLIWITSFVIWVDYYLDIWIITNQRLLDIEQKGFFNRTVSELDLKKIQDITSNVKGIIPTMFGFGSIQIQTAAEEKKFELKSVPHPVTARRKIIELYKKAKEKDKFIYKNMDE